MLLQLERIGDDVILSSNDGCKEAIAQLLNTLILRLSHVLDVVVGHVYSAHCRCPRLVQHGGLAADIRAALGRLGSGPVITSILNAIDKL